MTGPRDSHSATLVDGSDVVLAGGFAGEGQGALDGVEVYRDRSGLFEPVADLRVARGGHAAAALARGDVLIVGGWIASRTYTATAEIVETDTGTVRTAGAMPVAADALDAVTLADGRVLVTGGEAAPGVATAAAHVYDRTTDGWSSVGPMLTARFKHVSVLLADGRVLVIGGTTDDQKILATTEIFDPLSGRFTPGPALAEPRYKTAGGALLLPDGRVVVAGGGRSVEMIDVDTGTTTVVGGFEKRGSFATISRWGESLVVLGGYDDRIALRRDHLLVALPPRGRP